MVDIHPERPLPLLELIRFVENLAGGKMGHLGTQELIDIGIPEAHAFQPFIIYNPDEWSISFEGLDLDEATVQRAVASHFQVRLVMGIFPRVSCLYIDDFPNVFLLLNPDGSLEETHEIHQDDLEWLAQDPARAQEVHLGFYLQNPAPLGTCLALNLLRRYNDLSPDELSAFFYEKFLFFEHTSDAVYLHVLTLQGDFAPDGVARWQEVAQFSPNTGADKLEVARQTWFQSDFFTDCPACGNRQSVSLLSHMPCVCQNPLYS